MRDDMHQLLCLRGRSGARWQRCRRSTQRLRVANDPDASDKRESMSRARARRGGTVPLLPESRPLVMRSGWRGRGLRARVHLLHGLAWQS